MCVTQPWDAATWRGVPYGSMSTAMLALYVSRSHIICQQKSHHMSAECWPYMSADTHTHTHLICQQKLDHWSQALPGGHVQRWACSWGKKILVGKKKQTFWFYMSYTHIHTERERHTHRHTHTRTHTPIYTRTRAQITHIHTHTYTHTHTHRERERERERHTSPSLKAAEATATSQSYQCIQPYIHFHFFILFSSFFHITLSEGCRGNSNIAIILFGVRPTN